MRGVRIVSGKDRRDVRESSVGGAQRKAPRARGANEHRAAPARQAAGEVASVIAEAGGDARPSDVELVLEVVHAAIVPNRVW